MSKGYVYILTNLSMPGLVKIGKTCRNVPQRANELDSTGVPTPFDIKCCVFAPDCHMLEAAMHTMLAEHRVRLGREFFSICAEEAVRALYDLHQEQVEEWLSEFAPSQIAVEYDEHVDIGGFKPSVYEVMRREGITYPEFASVLYRLEGLDFEGAVTSYRASKAELDAEE